MQRSPDIFQNVEKDQWKGRLTSISSEYSKIHLWSEFCVCMVQTFLKIICWWFLVPCSERFFTNSAHCVKIVRIWNFSGPYFYTECGKLRTRKTLNKDTFHVVATLSCKRWNISILAMLLYYKTNRSLLILKVFNSWIWSV